MTVASYEFAGGDPIDHFRLGRVAPGDVAEFDDDPGPPWKAAKRRPSRPQSAEQDPPAAEPGSDVPDSPKEV